LKEIGGIKVENVESTSLILEGGGMRGVYTAGVLDLL
jgi:predicted patatin/cPLA2 family phospholipase